MKTQLLFFPLLLFFTVLISGSLSICAEESYNIGEIDSLIAHKQYTEALELSGQLLLKNPSDFELEIRTAKLNAWLGNYGMSIEICGKLLMDNPKNYDVMLLQAQAYFWDNQFQQAEELFRKVITEVPDYGDAYMGLINLLAAKKDFTGAIETALILESKTPDDIILLKKMIGLYDALGNYGKSIHYYNLVKQKEPSYAPPIEILLNMKRFTLFMNYGYDSLTKSYDPWQTAGAGISFRLSDKLTFTGESNIYRRFGLEDNTESVGITVNPSKMFGVSVAFQKCNNAEILPENRFNLNAMFNFGKWTSLSAGYNYFDFTEEKVNVVTAGIERYFLKHLSLSYQYFNSHALKTNSPNHLFRIGYSVERKFGVFGGYSTGREVYRILASQKPGVINGFSYIIGANYWITPFLGVNINSSFTSRKNYYDSKSAGGGFIWKF